MTDAHEALATVWREEWGRLLALLAGRYRRLDLAEDGLADAFETAAVTWPRDGVPANPPAWLHTAARRRVLDRLRAEAVAARKTSLLVLESGLRDGARTPRADPGDLIEDERLRLILLCCHPALSADAASALALRLVIGLPVSDIARLFLVREAAVAARITRAKHKIVAAGMPFALPGAEQVAGRVDRVADVAYLAFTAGYVPGPGPVLHRAELAGEAVRLVRVVRELAGPTPLVETMLALMLLQHARRDARQDPRTGDLVLLPDQDRSRWRHDEIREATALLAPHVARTPRGAAHARLLEALIAAEHAIAPSSALTRWDRILGWYDELELITLSPVVRLNRAVAVAETHGPRAGLALLDGLGDALPDNHRLAATRAELLARAGDSRAARTAYHEAISRCPNEVERSHLHQRLARMKPSGAAT